MEEELSNISDTLNGLLTQFIDLIPKIIAALVIFVIGIVLTMILVNALGRAMSRRKVKPEAATIIIRLSRISLITLTLVISLQQVGFNVTAFLTGLGILGFTVGFALQDVSRNFVSGILLLIQQPFAVGETIQVDAFTGKVLEVDLRATRIQTLDGRIVLIPNGDILTSPITNFSQSIERRIEIELGVAAESDPEQVRQAVFESIADIPGLLDEPEPQVEFHTFGEFTLNCTVFYWIDTGVISPVHAKDQGLEAINWALHERGIEMPYPIQTMVLKTE